MRRHQAQEALLQTLRPTQMSNDLWYGTSGPHNARIAIVGESWGDDERRVQKPFVGSSGQELTRILAEAGINRAECFITNVVAEQPTANEMGHFFLSTTEVKEYLGEPTHGLYPKPNVFNGLVNLSHQLRQVQPDIVVACGNYALWALGDDLVKIESKSKPGLSTRKMPSGIAKWRGSQLYCNLDYAVRNEDDEIIHIPKLVPIYHPAAIMRNWSWRYITVHDLKQRVATPWVDEDNYDFIVRPTYDQVMQFFETLLFSLNDGHQYIAVDLETRGGFTACIGIALDDRHAISIPLMCIENQRGYWTLKEELAITTLFRCLFENPRLHIYGQNFLYDMQYLDAEFMRVDPACVFDTMLAHHLCWPGTLKGLDYISSLYCRFHRYWKDEGKLWDTSIPEDDYWTYNCRDACATFECGEELHALILKLGLDEQWKTQQRQIGLVFRMMQRGINISKSGREKLTAELWDAVQERERWLEAAMPKHLLPEMKSKKVSPWYRSPIQQMKIFYDTLGIEPVKDRKTRRRSADDDALRIIGKREPALLSLVERLAELRSLMNFHNVVQTKLDPDGRMRCSFGIAGTETFRWNSSENAFGRGGNLQNISKGHEDD
jgi:uracil-DNA glycosylase